MATTADLAATKRSGGQHKIVAALIVIVIGVVVVWSIMNIAQAARHYHDTNATWLLGVAFGVANALSVYAWATAKTKALRTPAILGALLFGMGSGIIQTHLYLLENAPWVVALAFGFMGPLAEAILAWTEAAMRQEMDGGAEESASEQLAATQQELALANTKLAQAERDRQRLADKLANANTTANSRTGAANVTASTPTPTAKVPPPTAKPVAQPTGAGAGDLTPKQLANVTIIANAVRQNRITGAADLAAVTGVSERTIQRYLPVAVEAGYIYKNGDGAYHAQEGGDA